jgi:serine phosphatase RsbU (regulator of sigma subunit)
MKAGGDHFDLAEAASGNQLSVVLSDSSSYGLSSAVLSVLVRVAVKLTAEEVRSCESTVQAIQDELLLTLGEKDRLSMFYGAISRKDYRLRYVNMGSSAAFYAPPKTGFSRLSSQGPAFSKQNQVKISQAEIELQPEGRLVLVSDGFIGAAGGDMGLVELLNRFRDRESADLLNELVFQVKEKFAEPDDMPAQDCTVALFDIDARILRKI